MRKTIIIAEAGVNHNGDLEKAKQLIDAAAAAKVEYVKFQTFKASKLVTKQASKAEYQIKAEAGESNSQLEMLRKLELDESAHHELIAYCKSKNIEFLSTPFDLDSIELLVSLGITLGKIPSGEITNLPYLRAMARAFPQLILSTGMATLDEIGEAVSALIEAGAKKENLTILHCNTEYPTPMKDVNLLAMLQIRERFGVATGYSDHTLGTEIPIAAVALGATVIEKHFTLDRNLPGPDHKASLEPVELAYMSSCIRNIEAALGQADKKPSPSEIKNMAAARKSIVAARNIKKGEKFDANNLTVKRPGTGISPMKWDEVVGKTAVMDFEADEIIQL
ncbi:N-acetylneuraminate synthase [Chitinophaga deserti]|uniref:N-acetylneuraminate synthase n=1 Tax=Chitinophaga deserti TaxID=2164099 RepID=UPI000D6A876D|nr:N-acetylneuraminate synthase [Chitinophaga deserti]